MAEFAEMEDRDGVRMSWNVWPGSQSEANDLCVVPLAISYAPLHRSSEKKTNLDLRAIPVLPYSPVRCRYCRAFLNPFCNLDSVSNLWTCPFCFQRNHFPESYSSVIASGSFPYELSPDCTTVEYAMGSSLGEKHHGSQSSSSSPIFLFLVDTCVVEEELGFLKSSLRQAVHMMPPSSLVGLITFGSMVHIHELGFTEILKAYVFKASGDGAISKEKIVESLGLVDGSYTSLKKHMGVVAGVHDGLSAKEISRFLVPASECDLSFNSILDELQGDPWTVKADQRPARCTGRALSVAANLLSACVPGVAGRILSFVGGPCTEGLGMVVGKDLSDPMRSHMDLAKNIAPHYEDAVNYYEKLSKQLVNQGHVFDLFACSLDQVGVAEMKGTVEKTGGLVVLAESFGHPVFKDSFKRIFESGDSGLNLSFNGIFEVNCSRNLRVQGIIGPCASLHKKGQRVSDTIIGQGNTTAWKINGITKETNLSLFFEVVPKEASELTSQDPQQLFIQFLTYYQDSDGKIRQRATTITRQWVVGPQCVKELVTGFDQETSAVMLARMVSLRMETEAEFDATRWLDKVLISISSRFGDYRKNDPSSFSLSSGLSIFPQFIFNLRRSQFTQVFNNSPDETAYFRMLLNREAITNAVVMIQPSLISYSLSSTPTPVMLDVSSIVADRILLLDAYFTVIIFHGISVAQWRKEGYQNLSEHKVFADLLREPVDDANAIIKERFPVPRLVVCDQHTSQARFLLAKLNPSVTHKSSEYGVGCGRDVIFTDDVSFEVFMESLSKLAVQS